MSGGHIGKGYPEPRANGVFTQRQSPRVAKREFEQEATIILNEWHRRQQLIRTGEAPLLSGEDPQDWMLRCTYRLVKALVAAGHSGILADLVAAMETRHSGKTDISNKPFKQALLWMSWWGEVSGPTPRIERRRRSELSDAMEYAWLHKIESRELKLFIKRVGFKRIPAKLRTGEREPGFKVRKVPRVGGTK